MEFLRITILWAKLIQMRQMIKSATAVLYFARELMFFLSFSPPCGPFLSTCPHTSHFPRAVSPPRSPLFDLNIPHFSPHFPPFSPPPRLAFSTPPQLSKKSCGLSSKNREVSAKNSGLFRRKWCIVHRRATTGTPKPCKTKEKTRIDIKKIGDHTRTSVCDRRSV